MGGVNLKLNILTWYNGMGGTVFGLFVRSRPKYIAAAGHLECFPVQIFECYILSSQRGLGSSKTIVVSCSIDSMSSDHVND